MSWEEDRYVYGKEEEELTAQMKEEMIEEAKKQRQREYNRGMRAVKGMLAVYITIQVLSLLVELFAMPGKGDVGSNILGWFFRVILVVVLVKGLWQGRKWARILFAAVLVVAIFSTLQTIFRLDISRYDYSNPKENSYAVGGYIEENGVYKPFSKLGKDEIAKLQEEEDLRVKLSRILMGICIFDLLVCAAYLYILVGYHPARVFLDWQMNET